MYMKMVEQRATSTARRVLAFNTIRAAIQPTSGRAVQTLTSYSSPHATLSSPHAKRDYEFSALGFQSPLRGYSSKPPRYLSKPPRYSKNSRNGSLKRDSRSDRRRSEAGRCYFWGVEEVEEGQRDEVIINRIFTIY